MKTSTIIASLFVAISMTGCGSPTSMSTQSNNTNTVASQTQTQQVSPPKEQSGNSTQTTMPMNMPMPQSTPAPSQDTKPNAGNNPIPTSMEDPQAPVATFFGSLKTQPQSAQDQLDSSLDGYAQGWSKDLQSVSLKEIKEFQKNPDSVIYRVTFDATPNSNATSTFNKGLNTQFFTVKMEDAGYKITSIATSP